MSLVSLDKFAPTTEVGGAVTSHWLRHWWITVSDSRCAGLSLLPCSKYYFTCSCASPHTASWPPNRKAFRSLSMLLIPFWPYYICAGAIPPIASRFCVAWSVICLSVFLRITFVRPAYTCILVCTCGVQLHSVWAVWAGTFGQSNPRTKMCNCKMCCHLANRSEGHCVIYCEPMRVI